MKQDSLTKFIRDLRQIWSPLDSNLVSKSQSLLDALTKTIPAIENLQESLYGNAGASVELYRDPDFGFNLLAHVEKNGLYRPPHDHGNGWVIYAVQSGEMKMGTYANIVGEDGELRLVRRETYHVGPGQSRVYLPGDIHDSECVSDSVLMLRLTSIDLKEEQRTGRMHRYLAKA